MDRSFADRRSSTIPKSLFKLPLQQDTFSRQPLRSLLRSYGVFTYKPPARGVEHLIFILLGFPPSAATVRGEANLPRAAEERGGAHGDVGLGA